MTRTIPFDYSVAIPLSGDPGVTRQGRIEISIESAFTAIAIGYGVVPDMQELVFGPGPDRVGDGGFIDIANLTLRQIAEDADRAIAGNRALRNAVDGLGESVLRDGVRLAPRFAAAAANGLQVAAADLGGVFQLTPSASAEVPFFYAISEPATGRLYQNVQILSTAGLGSANGERPFRPLAVPIEFAPRTIIAIDITEASFFRGTLHMTLHGFKLLGQRGSPTDPGRIRRRRDPVGRAAL